MNHCTKQSQNMLDKKYQENIVPAEKQNNKSIYLGDSQGSPKVLFVGNSVTKHSIKQDIGWFQDCGMAASCKECDYVHIVSHALKEKYPQASFGILHVAEFERNFDKNFDIAEEFKEAIDWKADIVILFFGANVSESYHASDTPKIKFGTEYEKLRNHLDSGNTKFYHVEGFFLFPTLSAERYEICQKYQDTWIPLSGINTLEETHGLFNHPNDFGMKLIAERILENIREFNQEYRIYPVTKTDIHTENYEVKLNGQAIEVNTARVSAYPFNRAWPGHQRQIEQTELVNFVSFSCEGDNILEVKPKKKSDKFVIRPQSLNFKSELTTDGTIRVYMTKPAYFTIEPFGRKNALHVFADPMTEYTTAENEEVIYFGKGQHEVGVIELASNQTLFLDEGAVVYARVHAIDAKNIKIIGHGILDNSHNKEEVLFAANVENNGLHSARNAVRCHTIHLEYCENIEIKGITIRDSLLFTIVPAGCKNIEIENIKIIGNWRYNSDGIDLMNCQNVKISNSFIRTYDDSICAKGFSVKSVQNKEEQLNELMYHNGGDYSVFKDVLVENCVIWNDWGKCLEIGAETCAEEIYNFDYKNCDLIHVTGTVISCLNVDWADVHDISYENINIEYDEQILIPKIQSNDNDRYESNDLDFAPETIGLEIEYSPAYTSMQIDKNKRGKIRNFTYNNIRLYGRQKPFLFFKGFDEEHLCENIVIQNFFWNDKRLNKLTDFKLEINEFQKNINIK